MNTAMYLDADGRAGALEAFYEEIQPTCKLNEETMKRFHNIQCKEASFFV